MTLIDKRTPEQSSPIERFRRQIVRPSPITGSSNVYLTCKNQGGSLQHYYHFLLGLLVPLLEIWNEAIEENRPAKSFVRSCGPMDRHLLQLRLPGLKIISTDRHQAIGSAAEASQSLKLRVIEIHGRDDPRRYSRAAFQKVRERLFFAYAKEILQAREGIDKKFSGARRPILVITRLPSEEFYSTAASEIKTAGADRRSIPNIDEIVESLRRHNCNIMLDAMEGKSLFYQIALFSSVEVIVCQHGAALSNLIWTRPGTVLIEVMPRDAPNKLAVDHFRRLANCLSLNYRRLWQASLHAPIEPARVIEVLDGLRDGVGPSRA
jgi:hypothetical protein